MRESELRQETKVSEIRKMLQRKKGLQKQGNRDLQNQGKKIRFLTYS